MRHKDVLLNTKMRRAVSNLNLYLIEFLWRYNSTINQHKLYDQTQQQLQSNYTLNCTLNSTSNIMFITLQIYQ